MGRKADRLTNAVLAIGRLTHFHETLDDVGPFGDEALDFLYQLDKVLKPPVVAVTDGANVVSSLMTNGKHAPAIDLDMSATLISSSTEGHHHLYIDHEMTWSQYKRLLKVMWQVGLVQEGFYRSAVRRGSSFLRLPGVTKLWQ